MAITKITNDLIDFNITNTTSSLKMPTGNAFSGVAVDGMIRNDQSQTAGSAQSAMQHKTPLGWKNYATAAVAPYSMDYLIVGGGAGGGTNSTNSNNSGGGGAGGFVEVTGGSIQIGTVYTISIGAGGAVSTNGGQSKFLPLATASGGGYGGAGASTSTLGAGRAGASGGGGGGASTPINSGGAATQPTGQGFAGSSSYATIFLAGGSGGGAGTVGGPPQDWGPGPGGTGKVSALLTGSNIYYGGGGSGGAGGGGFTAGGGAGGGGTGGKYSGSVSATAGSDGYGGGGGGGYDAKGGGSGIVILKIPNASYSGTYTGSPTISYYGTSTILKFTGAGTYTG